MEKLWKNRIVGHGDVDPDELLANPKNWRIHPQQQQQALQGALEEIGWVDEIIVNEKTGFVVDGHLRVSLALRNNLSTIPVKYVDLNEDEEMVILAILDPIAAMAVTDVEKISELIDEISFEDERMFEVIDLLKDQIDGADYQPPSLSDLEKEFGDAEERELWPIIRLSLAPTTYSNFNDFWDALDGETDNEKAQVLLEQVHTE